MYALPLGILLIPYGIVLFFVGFFSLVNVYHLVHYGATTKISFLVTFVYLAALFLIMFVTWQLLLRIDWTTQIPLSVPSISSPLPSALP